MIALSDHDETIVGILFSDNRVQIYDFVHRATIVSQRVANDTIHFMGFRPGGLLFLLFPANGEKIYVCSGQGEYVEPVEIESIPNIHTFITLPEMKNTMIFSNREEFECMEIEGSNFRTCKIKHKTSCYAIICDPLNSTNLLILGKNPLWQLMTYSERTDNLPDFTIVSESVRNDVNCRSGSWVQTMPGYIITGDTDHGILYYWTLASGNITDRVSVYEYGIVTMKEIAPDLLALMFKDGVIGVYHVREKRLVTKTNHAHSSSIFSCGFLPTDPSILATVGADQLICLWKVPDMVTVDRYKIGHQSAIVDMSFSPGGTYIVCGTISGDLVVYSTQTKQIILEKRLENAGIVSVSWCLLDPAIVAVATSNKMCHLFNIEKRQVHKSIAVKFPLKRIQWSPQSKSVAICCTNGSLYIRRDGGTFTIIPGPGSPLCDVAWNPFDDNIVAASDDDGHVILFHVDTSTFEFEKGHNKGGPVAWSPIVPHILFSGAGDGTLTMWDIRSLKKLVSIDAHAMAITGIAVHKDRPFTIATVSKDETVRLWTVDRFFPSYQIETVLSGKYFDLEKFCPYEGSSVLAKLLHRLKKDGVKVMFKPGDVCHINDVLRVATNRITKLTASAPNDQATLARAPAARKRLIEAAELSLNSGDIKRYCELLFVAGEYNKALAAAPAVSYAFWQNLMMIRSDMMKGSEQSAQLALIAGKSDLAVNKLLALKEFDSAQLIIAALRDCTFEPKSKSYRAKTSEQKQLEYCQEEFAEPADYTAYKVASKSARKYAEEGKPLLAAAAFLSIGDVLSAQWTLVHSGNILWAKVISTCSEYASKIDDLFVEYCVIHGALDLVIDKLSKRRKCSLIPLMHFKDDRERDEFYMKHGLGSVLQHSKDGNTARGPKKVESLLLAGKHNEAQQVAVELIKPILASDAWDYIKVQDILKLLRNVTEPIPEIVAVSYICGVYSAMWRGYTTIIERMASEVESIASEHTWLQPRINELKLSTALAYAKSSPDLAQKYVTKSQLSSTAITSIPTGVTGGSTVRSNGANTVPVDIDAISRTSYCTGALIEGNYFLLEDGKTTLSDDEALMWFEVTPFSPLPTHRRLCPY